MLIQMSPCDVLCFDFYFVLNCLQVVHLGLTKTLEMVQRCLRGEQMARLRKSKMKMADYVANIALILAMMQPITDENVLYSLMEEWVNIYSDTGTVFRLLGNLVKYAVSSQHIYLLGLLIVKKVSYCFCSIFINKQY